MQVHLTQSEVETLIPVVRREAIKTQKRANAAYTRASKISNLAWEQDSLAYSLEDALRSEMDAFSS